LLPWDVLLTTYEIVLMDIEFISKFKFRYVVIDEAHRLKNPDSVLYTTLLTKVHMPHKLLLTGTPIQNNLTELWALLHFVMPSLYDDRELFLTWFKDLSPQNPKRTSFKKRFSIRVSPKISSMLL